MTMNEMEQLSFGEIYLLKFPFSSVEKAGWGSGEDPCYQIVFTKMIKKSFVKTPRKALKELVSPYNFTLGSVSFAIIHIVSHQGL